MLDHLLGLLMQLYINHRYMNGLVVFV